MILISFSILICAGAVSATSSSGSADNIYVALNGSDSNDGLSWNTPKLSIKNATGTVNTNGNITIANGTYTGTNNTGITIDKNMTIIGESQAGTIISGGNTNRIFYISPDANVNIKNLTFTNGNSTFDGGAISTDGNLTVENCTFTGNTAIYGGAIGIPYGNCSVNMCTFNNNSAISGYESGGGAIAIGFVGTCIITNSIFISNSANTPCVGGAIFNSGVLVAHFNRIYNNTSTNLANAIYNNGGSANITDNWWGSNNPNWENLISAYGNVDHSSWIYMNLTANTTNLLYGDAVKLTADFNHHFNGTDITSLTNGHIPNSVVSFASNDGSLNLLSKTTMEGLASSVFTPNHFGSVTVNATLDDQICSLTFNVDKMPTNLTICSLSGNNGKTVTLKATLKDYYGTPLNNKIVEFYVNNVKVGENSTDTNGVATLNYNITQIGGTYDITAKFLGNSEYMASTGNGTLKVNQSNVYVNVTTSKNNPTAGETIIFTFKLGNNGPDSADDVVFTYVIPEGMEFVSIETEPGYPEATYNATTRTITWPLGTVPKLDPWIKLNVLVLNSGAFNIISGVTTSTYDPNLGSNIQQITVNAVQTARAVSVTSSTRTIGMQKTGMPINYLILAILAVFGGLILPKRK